MKNNNKLDQEIEQAKDALLNTRIYFYALIILVSLPFALFPNAVEFNGVILFIGGIFIFKFGNRMFNIKAHLRYLNEEKYRRYLSNL